MDLYEKIKDIARQRKVSIRQVEEKLCFGNGTLNRWRTVMPSADKVKSVADYFDVSVDYLLGRVDIPQNTDVSNKGLRIIGNRKNNGIQQISISGQEIPLSYLLGFKYENPKPGSGVLTLEYRVDGIDLIDIANLKGVKITKSKE